MTHAYHHDDCGCFSAKFKEEMDRLKRENEKLRNVLTWYSESFRWQDTNHVTGLYNRENEGVFFFSRDTDFLLCDGGKRARECLKELERE